MNVERISDYEQDFDKTYLDSDGKKHTQSQKMVEIPGEKAFMKYMEVRPSSGDKSYFYPAKFGKDQIVLHYTMGYLKGDIASLTKPNNYISVPYLIGRNGTIYNLFASDYWSYHLGEGALGGNTVRSKATIAIELSNIGPLKKIGNNLVTTYNDNDVYCSLNQRQYYCEGPFRNFNYFATFTDQQYDSLIALLRFLTSNYKIPRKFLDKEKFHETTAEVSSFNGIVTHVNYRSSGKTDIGPSFDWERIKKGLNA